MSLTGWSSGARKEHAGAGFPAGRTVPSRLIARPGPSTASAPRHPRRRRRRRHAEAAVVALGALRMPGESERGFRVFADPAGHPVLPGVRPAPRVAPALALSRGLSPFERHVGNSHTAGRRAVPGVVAADLVLVRGRRGRWRSGRLARSPSGRQATRTSSRGVCSGPRHSSWWPPASSSAAPMRRPKITTSSASRATGTPSPGWSPDGLFEISACFLTRVGLQLLDSSAGSRRNVSTEIPQDQKDWRSRGFSAPPPSAFATSTDSMKRTPGSTAGPRAVRARCVLGQAGYVSSVTGFGAWRRSLM